MSGSFQSGGYHALVFAASPGPGGRQDFGMRRHKPSHELSVFVIYNGDFLRTEQTRFADLWDGHKRNKKLKVKG